MVRAVHAGDGLRAVARRYRVSLALVQYWVRRAADQRLERVDWADRPRGVRPAANRTPAATERRVLIARRALRERSLLGEYGARAIQRALKAAGEERLPSIRTIGRILTRHGVLDRVHRQRWPSPPPGWHLPPVAAGCAELDAIDLIEDLKLRDGPRFDVLTAISLHGRLPGAWPLARTTATAVQTTLLAHWRREGAPHYAQFDNDTRFQGPHQHRDALGRVARCCLQLGITPVFVPPAEWGFQSHIEHFNGLYQAKVWHRVPFDSLGALTAHSARYCAARCARTASRRDTTPARRVVPSRWTPDFAQRPEGQVIFIRRTTERGDIHVLGHRWPVDRQWAHRLVRAEVDLDRDEIRCYALRRRAPDEQPQLAVLPYEFPHRPFRD